MGSLKYHIKKIIKEEFDDFDWIKDISMPKNKIIIYSNTIINQNEFIPVLKWIEERLPGVEWISGLKPTANIPHRPFQFLEIDELNRLCFGHFDKNLNLTLERYISNGYYILKLSDLTLNESEDDDFKWIQDTQPWSPLNKKIVIDFKNDPNWLGWESDESYKLAEKVRDKLNSFDYNGIDWLDSQLENKHYTGFCYIFLDYRKEQNYNFITWMHCDSNIYNQDDIGLFEIMTATDFLSMT